MEEFSIAHSMVFHEMRTFRSTGIAQRGEKVKVVAQELTPTYAPYVVLQRKIVSQSVHGEYCLVAAEGNRTSSVVIFCSQASS